MKTIKTSELTGAALDWAVAKCEGTEHLFDSHEAGRLEYSVDWSQGGPIIEREGIGIKLRIDGEDEHAWLADDGLRMFTGPTPLIAAMRCYVASKLGDEVEVPEELFK